MGNSMSMPSIEKQLRYHIEHIESTPLPEKNLDHTDQQMELILAMHNIQQWLAALVKHCQIDTKITPLTFLTMARIKREFIQGTHPDEIKLLPEEFLAMVGVANAIPAPAYREKEPEQQIILYQLMALLNLIAVSFKTFGSEGSPPELQILKHQEQLFRIRDEIIERERKKQHRREMFSPKNIFKTVSNKIKRNLPITLTIEIGKNPEKCDEPIKAPKGISEVNDPPES